MSVQIQLHVWQKLKCLKIMLKSKFSTHDVRLKNRHRKQAAPLLTLPAVMSHHQSFTPFWYSRRIVSVLRIMIWMSNTTASFLAFWSALGQLIENVAENISRYKFTFFSLLPIKTLWKLSFRLFKKKKKVLLPVQGMTHRKLVSTFRWVFQSYLTVS